MTAVETVERGNMVKRPAIKPGDTVRVHDVAEALAAAESGCDYLIFGTVFPSRSKGAGHPVAGLEGLRQVATTVRVPVVAIGGISLENAASTLATGAAGVAAIDLFRGNIPLGTIVSGLRRSFDT